MPLQGCHRSPAIASTALVCVFHLFSAVNDIVKRCANEDQFSVNASSFIGCSIAASLHLGFGAFS